MIWKPLSWLRPFVSIIQTEFKGNELVLRAVISQYYSPVRLVDLALDLTLCDTSTFVKVSKSVEYARNRGVVEHKNHDQLLHSW